MRVTLLMTATADGFISKNSQDSAAWVEPYESFFGRKSREIGSVIMGMNTYRLLPHPFEDRLNIVMSTADRSQENVPGTLEFFSGEPADLLRILEEWGIHHVALIGGSQVNSSFLIEKLVDEIYLTVAPLLFGKGLNVACEYDLNTEMQLLDTKELPDGSVLLHYKVIK